MATGLFNLKQVNQAISQGAWSGYIAPRWVEYLVVAGGGGGSTSATSGGGGAGGLLTGIVSVTAGASYTVTVGAGGATAATTGNSGGNSVFGSISVLGGGGGSQSTTGASGGSGGGGGASGSSIGGSGTSGQGNVAGAGNANGNYPSGGGGGAGTIGLTAVGAVAGNGGSGIASAINGTVTTYAGGGGGGIYNAGTAGVGGVGGGGNGGLTTGTAGTANTGGGGGGAGTGSGAAGGSGIVIVRYPGNVQFYTGGTVTYSNGYIVHNFTANGTLAPTTPTVVSEYQISRSLRFNSADSAYLSRTPASAGNRRTWTFSTWVKRSQLSSGNAMLATVNGSALNYFAFGTSTGDFLAYAYFDGSTDVFNVNTSGTSVFRDVSAWYHIILAVDTTQATASNRVKIYVNNVEQSLGGTYPTQNYDTPINNSIPNLIGGGTGSYTAYLADQYMTEVNFIDGQALTPTSFGYVNPTTGVWTPAKFVGGYGTNGFYLNFSDNSNTTAATLGADYSGNGNNWTPNGFFVTAGVGNDSFVDSPTSYGTDTGIGGEVRGNYATLNPAAVLATKITLLNGNLQQGTVSGATYQEIPITLAVNFSGSNKWYAEVNTTTVSGTYYPSVAISSVNKIFAAQDIQGGATSDSTAYMANGQKYNNGSLTSYGSAFTSGDVVGIAVDEAAGTVVMYKNNVSQGTLASSLTGLQYITVTAHTGSNFYFNAGQRAFNYTAPSGFKALCTQNLPTPTIGATTATLATQYFTPTTYTGNGSASRAITNGINMASNGGLVWSKQRSGVESNFLIDNVRGNTKYLMSNSVATEATISTLVTSFDSTGYSIGNDSGINANGSTYVSWVWGAGGTGSTNTAGSITSTVSANTTSGFSIVTYTGNGGTNQSIGHGLGATPGMVIIKNRTLGTANWLVHHQSQPTGYTLYLNLTNAEDSGTSQWGTSAQTSTLFYVGFTAGATGSNQSGDAYVAYCFAEVAGYSKFGSYVGVGGTDGAFVFTGFRPSYVMIKATAGTDGWAIQDATRFPNNVITDILAANSANAEATFGSSFNIDFLSNGFKIRNATTTMNNSGTTYIYMAFASTPQKFSLAR